MLELINIAAAQDHEIVVEGARPVDPELSAPGTATVIEVDERLPPQADLAWTLDTVPGLSVRQLGGLGDWSSVSIRGSSLRQVQVYLDGVPLNPDGAQAVNLSELPLSAFSELHTWRGFAPPRYGAAPMGGVVDLITVPGAVPARFSVNAGSLGTARMSAMAATERGMVSAEVFQTRGDFQYFSDNGTAYNRFDDSVDTRVNNDKTQLSALARVRLGPLTLTDSMLQRDEGLPGHALEEITQARLSTTRNLGVAQVSLSNLDLRAWSLLRAETLSDPAGELVVSAPLTEDLSEGYGALAHARFPLKPWIIPAFTLSARADRFRRDGEILWQRPSAVAAASAELWLAQERLRIEPVLQAQTLGWSVDPRVAAAWDLGPVVLKTSAGRYLRPPDTAELYGDRGALQGNPDLLPERGQQADLGARYQDERLSVEATAFWTRSRDTITWVQNSQRTLYPVNVGLTQVMGVEGALSLTLPWLDASGSATFNHGVNLDANPTVHGNPLPRLPRLELSSTLSVHWEEWLRLGHTFSYEGPNTWDATAWYWSSPRPIHGAWLSTSLGPATLSLQVLNLLDRTTQVVTRDPLNPGDLAVVAISDFTGYPLPGRTVLLGLTWSPE